MEYDVLNNGKKVTTAVVESIGLYYWIHILCPAEENYGSVFAETEKGRIKIGRLLKDGHHMRLDKKLSVSVLGKAISFFVLDTVGKKEVTVFNLKEDAPYPHLDKLEYSYYVNGDMVIDYPPAGM